jgi:hypothetical protein
LFEQLLDREFKRASIPMIGKTRREIGEDVLLEFQFAQQQRPAI